jgi:hypothetical protein
VISAHDFFLACPNGAFADLRSGQPCPLVPLSRACLTAPCDRHSRSHKLLRVVRHAIQTVFDPAKAPPVLAIHAGMAPYLARAGISRDAIHALPNPVVPWSAQRIAAEDNREVLFVGRLEETKGPDLAAAARAPGCRCAWSVPARWKAACARAIPRRASAGAFPRRNRPRGAAGQAAGHAQPLSRTLWPGGDGSGTVRPAGGVAQHGIAGQTCATAPAWR